MRRNFSVSHLNTLAFPEGRAGSFWMSAPVVDLSPLHVNIGGFGN